MVYRDVGAEAWESAAGGFQRKEVVQGITLWNVATSASLPLEHKVQTLLVLSGSGKIRVGELVFVLSPGVVLVLPRGGLADAMPSGEDPLTMLEVADLPRASAQPEERRRDFGHKAPGDGSRPEFPPRPEAVVEPEKTPEPPVEPPTLREASEPAFTPPAETLPPPVEQVRQAKDPVVQEGPSRPGESPLARYLQSSPVSGRMRRPVGRDVPGR